MNFKKLLIYLLACLCVSLPALQAAGQANPYLGQANPYLGQDQESLLQQGQGNDLDSSTGYGTRSGSSRASSLSGFNYQVHILGEVKSPGTYRLPPSTRLSEAIQIAGGLLERGSLRNIELRRQGGGRQKIDLFTFKQEGNLDANPYLLDNDVIFVPLKGKVVQVQGAVKRPGTFELVGPGTVAQAIQMAGGFTSGLEPAAPIKIIRFENDEKKLLDVESSSTAMKGFPIENADVVVVPHILTHKKEFDYNLAKLPDETGLSYPSYDDRIFVLGGVYRPGPYPFNPYYDVRQYLTVAAGTTKLAKTNKIRIVSSEGKTRKANETSEINPGDTIIVPEKYLAPETFATLMLGIAASVVGITSSVIAITR